MVRALVGLGNPGKRYERTPHNAGFAVLDVLAGRAGLGWRRSLRWNARVAKGEVGGVSCLLLEPLTFMNNSGLAVAAALLYSQIIPCIVQYPLNISGP